MPQIDFTQIRPMDDGEREAFEELCCQIFRQAPEAETGARFRRVRGAGGDGGVEAIWISPSGEKWGLQSKYFLSLEASQKAQMKGSLDKALTNHPELKRYTFAIPIQLTGSTGAGTKRPRTGANEKLDGWISEWQKELTAEGVQIEIDWWDATELSGRLQAIDPTGGRQRYWFNRTILTDDWFENHLKDALKQAGNRYTPDLSIHVPLLDDLESFAQTENLANELQSFVATLKRHLNHWNDMPEVVEEGTGWRGPPVPESLLTTVKRVSESLEKKVSELEATWTDPDVSVSPQFFDEVADLIGDVSHCEAGFLQQLSDNHGDNADTPGFRQFSAEYQVSFPAANLDLARELHDALSNLQSGDVGRHLMHAGARHLLVHGPAGVGKTHALVDNALDRQRRYLRTIILFGEDFSTDEPTRTIGYKLGLDGNIGRDELFALLEAAAEASGHNMILCIDALNETSPERRRWRSWYPPLAEQVARCKSIKLLVSCRDTYLSDTLPDWASIPNVEHNGFLGREYDVVPKFFEHYGLTLPGSPLLQPEFGNPLFLHILCQSLNAHGLVSIPDGGGGFTAIINEFLSAKNHVVSEELGYHHGEPQVQRAIARLAQKMNELGAQRIPIDIAKGVVSAACTPQELGNRLFGVLEKESLISVVPDVPALFGSTPEYSLRFSFERMTDHLRATSYLTDVSQDDVSQLFEPGGALAFTIESSETISENRGILESLAIILPEKFEIELVDATKKGDLEDELEAIVLESLQWRSPATVSCSTLEIITRAFMTVGGSISAIDALLSVCTRPSHPLNAEYLNKRLRTQPLELRDAYFPLALYELYEADRVPKRLIDWALSSNLENLNQETAYLWATALSWFLAAADRRIRDKATKGLVRISECRPQILSELNKQFADCNDDYIRERVLVATYGALLRNREYQAVKDVADTVWQSYFADPDSTPLHASIRDHARLILELALGLDVLPADADPEVFRPPYHSEWPMELPTEEAVAPFQKDNDRFPHQMDLDTNIGTDFARYKVDSHVLDKFEDADGVLDRGGVLRHFLQGAAEMGYPCQGDLAAYYDHLMNRNYGAGRARKGWAERVGKKYYWILLHQLLGRVSDHLPHRNDFDEIKETAVPPLQALELRDIDPTDLRIFQQRQYEVGNGDWLIGNPHDFSATAIDDDKEWALTLDLQGPDGALTVTSPVDGKEWVVLSSNYDWRDPPESVLDDDVPFRRVGRGIWSGLTAAGDREKLLQKLSAVDFVADIHGLSPIDYRGYLAEYPRELSYRQRYESGDLYEKTTVCGVSIETTHIDHLKGGEWEYDFSADREASKSLLAPSPSILNFKTLAWDGDRGWIDSNQDVQAMCLRDHADRSVLLVQKDYLDEMLARQGQSLVWFVLQTKFIVGRSSSPGPRTEVWSVYELRDGSIACIGSSTSSEDPAS